MHEFRAFSPGLRTTSRWSISPVNTGVSQVPQLPSLHDDSTNTPASSTTSKAVLLGVRISMKVFDAHLSPRLLGSGLHTIDVRGWSAAVHLSARMCRDHIRT